MPVVTEELKMCEGDAQLVLDRRLLYIVLEMILFS